MTGDRKVAFVTGGGSGIGQATGQLFAERGYATAIVDRNEAGGRATEAAIRAAGGEALFIACDVADDPSVRNAVERTVAAYGRLDAAFNAAGVDGRFGKMAGEISIDQWNQVIAVNLTGLWFCMRHQIAQMLENGGGAIVNCSSTAGIRGAPRFGAYCASKHGVVGLTRSAAQDYSSLGIRINAVLPGTIATPMTQDTPVKDLVNRVAEQSPMRRIGQPSEIGRTVLWLCSDDASYVAGQAIAVDGAQT
jgi:NAD(P)-dependent dehydrogenase (short-subunit alcohol dehydrogenase family)